jgi:hypothetical protein
MDKCQGKLKCSGTPTIFIVFIFLDSLFSSSYQDKELSSIQIRFRCIPIFLEILRTNILIFAEA